MLIIQIVELISVLLNITFVILFIKEVKWCWLFGIIGSLTQSFVVFDSGYYSEALLYMFYAIMGVIGFVYWSKNEGKEFNIKRIPVLNALILLLVGIVSTYGLGLLMSKLKAEKVYLDAFSTVFGIIATFLEIYKYLIAWYCWIALNAYTIWLYQIKELNLLSIQMIVFTVLSIQGLVVWNAKVKARKRKQIL
jgi:nicotinamide mononucleotide transporter